MASYQQGGASRDEEATPLAGNPSSPPVQSAGPAGWKKFAAVAGLVALVATAYSRRDAVIDEVEVLRAGAKGPTLELFDESRRYVLRDYDTRPPVSNFLPGLAGVFGKPVWSFYVNRGQGIASFGTTSKDYPLMEFQPANKAYQDTAALGFRTFLQGTRAGRRGEGGTSFSIEPFSPGTGRVEAGDPAEEALKPTRTMYVGTNEMEIHEDDAEHGVSTSVTYFVLPDEDFAALVRRTTITNTGADALTLGALDGLAKIQPYGGKLGWGLKFQSRLLEAWMGVYHATADLTLPYFRMSTEPGDSASVVIEKAGHYCIAFVEGAGALLPIVYDSDKVFGTSMNLQDARGLLGGSVADLVKGKQYGNAKTSSAFAALETATLAPGESVTISSFYGQAAAVEDLPGIAAKVSAPGFAAKKLRRARTLTEELTAGVETHTASHLFDGAVKQAYMDNSLRGGMPLVLGDLDDTMRQSNADEDSRLKVYHVYSRIHGDLERDYNDFVIDPTYFSQGPGNFRDVAQNRRNDVIFNPRIGAFDVKLFLSFIQGDGYNPLTVEAVVFQVGDANQGARVASQITADAQSAEIVTNIFAGGIFRPGQIFSLFEQIGVKLNDKMTKQEVIDNIMSIAESLPMATFGSGYWGDHWDYFLDLIEAYNSIYPDAEEALMYDTELQYFFSTATVKPRSDKYVVDLTADGQGKHVLQLEATVFDMDKAAEQESFRNSTTGLISNQANWQRTQGKDGKVSKGRAFTSTPLAKLFLLSALKFATRDAYGVGIEYEGGRPGWCDALNGLPGMIGSGMPETFELSELLKYIIETITKYQRPVVIPAELGTMIDAVNDAIVELESSGYAESEEVPADVPTELFKYWDTVATAREAYRHEIAYYFSGDTVELSAKDATKMLTNWFEQVQVGIARSFKIGSAGKDDDGKTGVPPGYFYFDVTDWTNTGKHNAVGLPLATAKSMKVATLPIFLEGATRYMKLIKDDSEKMEDMYNKVKASPLRDHTLKMYFLNADLEDESYDIGRIRSFFPGWLENASIFMHMSYKYYLQLLRGKLFDQFFTEMKTDGGMIPFMNPDVYGRSLFEMSSFIASGAFDDPAVQGRGYQARLSGSTSEYLSVWKLMFMGPGPFLLNDDGELEMKLVPALPIWLFEDKESGEAPVRDDEGHLTVSWKLFASIMVTYHNTLGTDLFDVEPTKYVVHMKDGADVEVDGPSVPAATAILIRKLWSVKSIDVYF